MIHDGQLAALAHVARVGEQLAHELDQRFAANHVDALLAIGRKQHVAGLQRHGLGHPDGFLAVAAHIKGDLSLALRSLHAVIEDAREQHVAQADLQVFGFEARVPLAHGFVLVIEHAHQADRHLFHIACARIDIGFVDGARGRQLHIAEVGFVARPRRGLRYMKSWHRAG